MIWEMAGTLESATHVQIGQIQESWSESTHTVHLRVTYGTVDGDGAFTPSPVLKTGEVRILPDEYEAFRQFQKDTLGVPEGIADSHEWRRADVARYLDATDGWQRIF